jgi:hypothetical protein
VCAGASDNKAGLLAAVQAVEAILQVHAFSSSFLPVSPKQSHAELLGACAGCAGGPEAAYQSQAAARGV